MSATLAQAVNDAESTLAAPLSPGATTVTLKTGDGAAFGTPLPGYPLRFGVVAAAALEAGAVTDPARLTTYLATGRTGDTLTGVTLESGTAQAYAAGDAVGVWLFAQTITEIHAAIADHATRTDNPHAVTAAQIGALAPDGSGALLTNLQGAAVSGDIAGNAGLQGLAALLGTPLAGLTPGGIWQKIADLADYARANLSPILQAFGARTYSPLGLTDSAAPAVGMGAQRSTFTGWGSAVGTPPPFNVVETEVQAWDITNQPGYLMVRVRSVDQAGAVLGQAIVAAPVWESVNTPARVIFTLPAVITPTGPVWIEVLADGRIDYRPTNVYTYTTALGYPTTTWTTAGTLFGTPPTVAGVLASKNVYFGTRRSDAGPTYEPQPFTAFARASANFNGYGADYGVVRDIDVVEWDIQAWELAAVPANVRLQMFLGDFTGTLVVDKVIPVAPRPGGAPYRVNGHLDTPLQNPTGLPVWVQWWADGYTGFRENTASPQNARWCGGFTNLALTPSWNTGVKPGYMKFANSAKRTRRVRSADDAKALAVKNLIAPVFTPTLSVPAQVCAVVGREVNAYFDNYTMTPFAPNSGTGPVEHFIGSAYGQTQNERWTYVPQAADIGDQALTFNARWNDTTVATVTTVLRVKAAKAAAVVNRSVVTLGDSLTKMGYALAECHNLANVNCTSPTAGGGPDNMTLTFKGTQFTTPAADAGGTSRTIPCEAVAGTDIAYWDSGNSPVNPFLKAGVFDFANYLQANAIVMTALDWVWFLLSTNDVSAAQDDTALMVKFSASKAYLDAMIASVKAAVPGIRILIGMTPPTNRTQDGFGASLTNLNYRSRTKRNTDLWHREQIRAYGTQTANNIHLCGVHLNIDPVNNFPLGAPAPVNARSNVWVRRPNNNVHYAPSGMYQMADMLVSHCRGQES